MKILHIISSGGMYGAEAVILNLSRVLNESSHSSVLGVFSNSPNPNLQLHERALKEGIESNLIPCNGQIDRSVVTSIRELVARTQADVVHAHGYKADIYTYFALRKLPIPLVSTCHTWYDNDVLLRIYGMIDRLVLQKYAAVVAVSDEVKQRLINAGVFKEKTYLIKNGIDLRPFNEVAPSLRGIHGSNSALTVGLVGRLSEEKGIDIFVQAAAHVLIKYPATKFVVIGEGPDRDKLNSVIEKLQIQQSVSLLGRREDMPSVYASLDLMVSSSRQEGLPMAILEGMASGLPLVATAVGDVPTVVMDRVTGVIVPPEDVVALTAAIIELLQDAALRKRFGNAARKLIEEEFSAEQMARNYLHIYDQAIATKSAMQNNGLEVSSSPVEKSGVNRTGK